MKRISLILSILTIGPALQAAEQTVPQAQVKLFPCYYEENCPAMFVTAAASDDHTATHFRPANENAQCTNCDQVFPKTRTYTSHLANCTQLPREIIEAVKKASQEKRQQMKLPEPEQASGHSNGSSSSDSAMETQQMPAASKKEKIVKPTTPRVNQRCKYCSKLCIKASQHEFLCNQNPHRKIPIRANGKKISKSLTVQSQKVDTAHRPRRVVSQAALQAIEQARKASTSEAQDEKSLANLKTADEIINEIASALKTLEQEKIKKQKAYVRSGLVPSIPIITRKLPA